MAPLTYLARPLDIREIAMNLPALDSAKAAMRKTAGPRRDDAAAAAGDMKDLSNRLLTIASIPAGAAVSGYWPMRSELDPRPVLTALSARGHPLCLPVVVGKEQPLVFRAWRPGDDLLAGGYGTRVPDAEKEVVVPHLLLVPLLAFDRAGYRLGYGGGFYDRTLAGLRTAGPVLAVGLAFAAQEVDSVPHGATDERLDWIVTEAEAIEIESGGGDRGR